ncbi:ECF RNA polymerase sigma factor SigK [Brachybacterium halotolerans subsp. kimchii]|uniref:ECF RNA polymerase sigma factor SigK n=1 Tax=Brachybacterium halotolerans TaxID=2795215 RepID=UPI001E38E071|nr:ECF RNA polymerase sigma factor SigK [Brachybacterium halotolerans]UEJ81730.1 ECF RNA polymerase sigma factor SigK [Brachybacterium halotolerans subsp. kimchii]
MTTPEEEPAPAATASADVLRGLLLAVAGGDAEAFPQLYDSTSTRVFGLVLRVLRDRAQSEEVTQEVYLEVFRRASSFDPSRGSALAWILTMAHRRAVDRVRASQSQSDRDVAYESRSSTEQPDPTSETALDGIEARHVRGALSQLSDRQSEAIRLAYLDGLTQSQVAERLSIPLGTAKTRIRDGLLALRRIMSTEHTREEER